jgi:RNA polymerase sigma-70 factor, ECF subfamily
MNLLTEQELLKSTKVFNLTSLGMIYDQYSPGIYRYALRLLGDECLAEDCVADTFSRFLKTLRADQGPDTHLQAYLYRIAHNWITDTYRRHPLISIELDESLQIDDTKSPESIVDNNLQHQGIRMALQALTPDQRQVISLRFIEGWQNEEVAEAMQKPIGAIKALQHRALDTLRRLLSSDEKASQNGFEQ